MLGEHKRTLTRLFLTNVATAASFNFAKSIFFGGSRFKFTLLVSSQNIRFKIIKFFHLAHSRSNNPESLLCLESPSSRKCSQQIVYLLSPCMLELYLFGVTSFTPHFASSTDPLILIVLYANEVTFDKANCKWTGTSCSRGYHHSWWEGCFRQPNYCLGTCKQTHSKGRRHGHLSKM